MLWPLIITCIWPNWFVLSNSSQVPHSFSSFASALTVVLHANTTRFFLSPGLHGRKEEVKEKLPKCFRGKCHRLKDFCEYARQTGRQTLLYYKMHTSNCSQAFLPLFSPNTSSAVVKVCCSTAPSVTPHSRCLELRCLWMN